MNVRGLRDIHNRACTTTVNSSVIVAQSCATEVCCFDCPKHCNCPVVNTIRLPVSNLLLYISVSARISAVLYSRLEMCRTVAVLWAVKTTHFSKRCPNSVFTRTLQVSGILKLNVKQSLSTKVKLLHKQLQV